MTQGKFIYRETIIQQTNATGFDQNALDITIPMKGLAAAVIDSHSVVPRILCRIQPSFMMTHCNAPM